ncbi:hypothetical protein HYU19_00810 [Candidatus Woesearchaeota archaeon]|nr:hypothetical protein [Candidatus Woesearchaeota archaeon]
MNKQGILHAILPTLILLLVVFSVLPGCSPPPFPKFMPPPPMAPADAGGVPTSAPHADGQGEGREWIPPVPSAQQDAARQENAANNRHTEENGRTEDDKANILASLVTISSHLRSHPLRTASSAAFSLNGVKGMVRSSSTHSRLMLEI